MDSPPLIAIEFSESIDPSTTTIDVTNADSVDVPLAAPTFEGDRHVEARFVERVPEGGYVARWRTVSASDGHVTSGSWAFAVGNATVPHAGGIVSPSPKPEAVLGKALAFLGLALAGGAIATRTFVLREDPVAQRAPWLRRTLGVAAAFQLAGILLFSGSQVLASGSTAATYLTATSFGRGLVFRAALAAILLASIGRSAGAAFGRSRFQAGLVGVSMVAYGWFSHTAATLRPALLGVALDSLHLLAAAAWAGGLVCMWFLVTSSVGGTVPTPLRLSASRFSRLAFFCVLILAVTGTLQTVVLLGARPQAWPRVLTTPYGQALAAKILGFLGMVALGAVNRFAFVRRYVRGHGHGTAYAFRRNLLREVALAVAVLALAGLVTSLSPVTPIAGLLPLVQDAQGEVYHFHLVVDPAPAVGVNSTFTVTLTNQTGAPVDDAFRLILTFEAEGTDLGRTSVPSTHEPGGHYVVAGTFFARPGRWALYAAVSTPEAFSDAVGFDIMAG